MTVAALAEHTGERFPAVMAARERTAAGLAERRERLADIVLDPDATVVLLGSWGRHEVTSASDDDAIVLFCGARRDAVQPEPGVVANRLGGPAPGPEGLFGATAWLADLTDRIGLDGDTNTILTRRMLFLLESVPVAGDAAYGAAREALLGTYLAAHERDFRPPRFLLNDLVRYWRTIAVDFEGKHRARSGDGWGLRHAKLRFSRKVLFAGGLLPVLACHALPAAEMPAFLAERLAEPPLDRVASAFLTYGMADAGARAVHAYAAFLELLDDPISRAELAALTEGDSDASELFARVRALGDDLQNALLALLFEEPRLERLVRDYLVF
ncbi:MAG: hypothetical protein QOF76_5657 [Solirubrobacteraceae bacterium]|jgi:hypothetical protein|nr:hypothetical protein [Solirubrobacteraceae bacterium]